MTTAEAKKDQRRLPCSSITTHVDVEVERDSQVLPVTEAEVVYVGVVRSTPERKPKPLLEK
jgi:hypothetical protein